MSYPKALKARSGVEEMHELRGQRTDDLLDDKQLIDVTVARQQRLAVTQLSQNASHRPNVYRLAIRRSASCHTIKVKRFSTLNFNSFPSLFCVSCASLNRKLSLFDTFYFIGVIVLTREVARVICTIALPRSQYRWRYPPSLCFLQSRSRIISKRCLFLSANSLVLYLKRIK